MARARNSKLPFPFMHLSPFHWFISASPFSSLLFSSRKHQQFHQQKFFTHVTYLALFILFCSFTFLLVSILIIFVPFSQESDLFSGLIPSASSRSASRMLLAALSPTTSSLGEYSDKDAMAQSILVPLPVREISGNLSEEERELWKQPDGEGYKPCLDFTLKYRKESNRVSKEKRKFLVVIASGGLNQQKNQIIDAVVIARILQAALVVPILQINPIWGDESEFSDIFDVEHFKKILQSDVRIVSSLPSTHFLSRQSIQSRIPPDVSPFWFRTKFSRKLEKQGVLVLKGFYSKLSKNLSPDLQKLKCKVAFHALKFAPSIQDLGNRLARRMWIEGPYVALHLRLEKDVWARTGCRTGLKPEFDSAIAKIRESQPEYISGRLNMSHHERRLAGLCPLNSAEMARLLKGLGAKRSTRIYIAGGEPYGGNQALQPLAREFPHLVTKQILSHNDELSPYMNKSSAMAAIDFIVSLNSDVFMPSHGGNMAKIIKGHRAYVGHRKHITPNKRALIPLLEGSISDEEFGRMVRKLHRKSDGQPEIRTNKSDRDVLSFPVPDCMCKHRTAMY